MNYDPLKKGSIERQVAETPTAVFVIQVAGDLEFHSVWLEGIDQIGTLHTFARGDGQ